MLALIVLAVVFDRLGVAGYRYGATAVTVALPIVVGGIAWLLTRHRWAAATLAVLAVVVAGVLATRAPWSAGRLEAALDDLDHLDGFEVVDTSHEAHSWCQPTCPRVTRTWTAPHVAPAAAVVLMTIALSDEGLAPPVEELPSDLLTEQVVVNGSKVDAVITAQPVESGDLQVTVVLSSHR